MDKFRQRLILQGRNKGPIFSNMRIIKIMRNLLILIMSVSWIVKMGIHYHLDLKSVRRTGLPPAGMIPIYYFFPLC